MNLADIRTRLAGLEGRAYWRSLEELSDTPEFRQYVHREFPAQASEFNDPAGRRQFLKLMGASLALAGVSACTRQPPEKIVPYVRQPEEIIPGRPLFFATAMPLGGVGMPLLAENHMGRPTKLEGNPEHPASLGATDVLAQASVLDAVRPGPVAQRDQPGRSEDVERDGPGDQRRARTRARQGRRRRPDSDRAGHVTVARRSDRDAACGHAPGQVASVGSGLRRRRRAERRATSALYRFDQADVVVSLDADFLGFGPAAVRYTKDFSSRRRMGTPSDQLNRLYVVEPVPTVTGANADHRLAAQGARRSCRLRARSPRALGVAGATGGHAAERRRVSLDSGDRQGPRRAPRDVGGRRRRPSAGRGPRARARDEPGARQRRRHGHLQRAGRRIAGRRRRVVADLVSRHGRGSRPGAVRPRDESDLHGAGGPRFPRDVREGAAPRAPRALSRRDRRALSLARARSALPRVVGRCARVRRHGLADSAADRADLRRTHGHRAHRRHQRRHRRAAWTS